MASMKDTAIALLQEAVDKAGGIRKAAPEMGVSHAALSRWLSDHRGKQMDSFFSALESVGARIVSSDGCTVSTPPIPSVKDEQVRRLEERVKILQGQVEILQTIIYALSGKTANLDKEETKKRAS